MSIERLASPVWARFQNRRGSAFASTVAPRIRSYYETTLVGQTNRNLLDVCCGAGQLARHFLDHGYRVTGVDLSEHMLRYARRNAGEHLVSGRAHFLRADATDFVVEKEFGLATSTFDALNLLDDLDALRNCFRCVFDALVEGGVFVFDLMARSGFWRDYNGIWVYDQGDVLYVYRSVYDGAARATARMTGFLRTEEHAPAEAPAGASGSDVSGQSSHAGGGGGGGDQRLWERFEEFRTVTYFPIPVVIDALNAAGWTRVWVADTRDVSPPAADPEALDRVFFVTSS